MKLPLEPKDARRLATMADDELAAWLAICLPKDLLMLDAAFELWAAEGQIEPDEAGWRVWLMVAQRGATEDRLSAQSGRRKHDVDRSSGKSGLRRLLSGCWRRDW